ncbi:MAG: hypothetical protein OEY81_04380, partial [Candidatus Bathyarchaeota archaeon]|nr:hypothetical protein [Candidatus Bathyarchaeota archaeon]
CILKRNSKIFEAIRKLFIIQKMKSQSFTLFLTICSVQEGDHKENIQALRRDFDRNLDDQDVERTFLEKYPNSIFEAYHDFQSVTIPKRIVEYGLSEGFDTKCNEKFTYIGEGLSTRMVSLIFECEYLGQNYLAHLAGIRKTRILEILENDCRDINQMMEQDEELLQAMTRLKSRYSEHVP